MAYLVNITPRAERDLANLFVQINAGESDAALKWYRGLKRSILTLDESPARCPPTPEAKRLRHLLYGKKPHIYRVIYRVVERRQRVDILHIRHGAMRPFTSAAVRSARTSPSAQIAPPPAPQSSPCHGPD